MNRSTILTLCTVTLVAGLTTGCNRSMGVQNDGMSFHERQAYLAAKADRSPGAMDRSREMVEAIFMELPKRVIERMRGTSAGDMARGLRSPNPADRRMALLDLASRDFGGQADYVTVYKGYAQSDPDPTVRAAAIRALNLTRSGEPAVFVSSLNADEPLVRLEAAKALSNLPDESAVQPLLKVAEDKMEDIDIRIAAADALKHYPQLDVARRLANLVGDNDFSIAWQAGQSLKYLTGMDYDYRPGQWLTFLSESEKPFG
ncbi:MAG: HEAT repeat domain-containing protein [Planctomycetota bacterium]